MTEQQGTDLLLKCDEIILHLGSLATRLDAQQEFLRGVNFGVWVMVGAFFGFIIYHAIVGLLPR